jgi:hypothetical protein
MYAHSREDTLLRWRKADDAPKQAVVREKARYVIEARILGVVPMVGVIEKSRLISS